MSVKPALIMIDMQNGFLNESSPLFIRDARKTVPACAEMIRFCRKNGIPLFFVTRMYRTDGSNVEHTRYPAWINGGKPVSPDSPPVMDAAFPEEFGLDDRDFLIFKPRFSAFFQTELDLLLRRLEINTVLLAGTTTPNCIRTSCYDAISLDYNVVVLTDCTSSATEEIQAANLLDMQNVGAQLMTSVEYMQGKRIIDNLDYVRSRMKAEQKEEKGSDEHL